MNTRARTTIVGGLGARVIIELPARNRGTLAGEASRARWLSSVLHLARISGEGCLPQAFPRRGFDGLGKEYGEEKSHRAISTARLKAFLPVHLPPIHVVVCHGPSSWWSGGLILRRVSHLDAFSAYPLPAWLPGAALGRATGRPAAGPARSSRTKASTPQTSNARNR